MDRVNELAGPIQTALDLGVMTKGWEVIAMVNFWSLKVPLKTHLSAWPGNSYPLAQSYSIQPNEAGFAKVCALLEAGNGNGN